MKLFSPLFVFFRLVIYGLITYGMAEIIFFDAANPYGDSYFSERALTEILQEIILFTLFGLFLFVGYKYKKIQPFGNLVALFFLASFIREFNFLDFSWSIPALVVLLVALGLFYRDRNKMKAAFIQFFRAPASVWLWSGFLLTYIFSRLLGRSKFWLLMYSEDSYRLAKAATEEGLELMGDTLMLVGAVEFFLFWYFSKRKE
jgi:hypothetical protein